MVMLVRRKWLAQFRRSSLRWLQNGNTGGSPVIDRPLMKLEIVPSKQSRPADFYHSTVADDFTLVASTVVPIELSTYNRNSPTRAHAK